MSEKAENIIKEITDVCTSEGIKLSDFHIELLTKIIDGEITREQAYKIIKERG